MKKELLLLSLLLFSMPWIVRAENWQWSIGGAWSIMEYSHKGQSGPEGFYASAWHPELRLTEVNDFSENNFRIAIMNLPKWKYRSSNESAPDQKMFIVNLDWEQHRFQGRKSDPLFHFYFGPESGITYRRWRLNYDGGADLNYHWVNMHGGVVAGSRIRFTRNIGLDVQSFVRGLAGYYMSSPTQYTNHNGVESGYRWGFSAKARLAVTQNISICPTWRYDNMRDYSRRYSLKIAEQTWMISIQINPFHAK